MYIYCDINNLKLTFNSIMFHRNRSQNCCDRFIVIAHESTSGNDIHN